MNPKFLGITFDESLKVHTENLLKRAPKRLNTIKILIHRSCHLSHVSLKDIYSAIIGSLFIFLSLRQREQGQLILERKKNVISIFFQAKTVTNYDKVGGSTISIEISKYFDIFRHYIVSLAFDISIKIYRNHSIFFAIFRQTIEYR